jgi:DNA-binding transcriptional MocR family regulator
LSAVERQVGATLLDSFNRKTGQCDPSLDRVASLLNVHRRTVIRATAKLEARGLFRKTRHGGYSHRNHYEPIWSKFRDLENKWRSRFGAAARARRTGKSSSGEHASHDSGDADATQTSCTNQSNSTLSETCRDAANGSPIALSFRKGSAMQVQQQEPPYFRTPSMRSAEAARCAAERRWSDNLRCELANQVAVYCALVDFIDEALRIAATEAELCRRGDGLKLILERYRSSGHRKGPANA